MQWNTLQRYVYIFLQYVLHDLTLLGVTDRSPETISEKNFGASTTRVLAATDIQVYYTSC